MTTDKELRQLIIEGIHERKGRGVTVLDLSHIEYAGASCFIIAEGTSTTQTVAIAESVAEYVRKASGVKPFAVDGEAPGDWVILDYGDIWVHIFLPETRAHYNLEDHWSDAKISRVADLD